ncbi:MAG: hypothetical protein ABIB43_04045 [archaeon]
MSNQTQPAMDEFRENLKTNSNLSLCNILTPDMAAMGIDIEIKGIAPIIDVVKTMHMKSFITDSNDIATKYNVSVETYPYIKKSERESIIKNNDFLAQPETRYSNNPGTIVIFKPIYD